MMNPNEYRIDDKIYVRHLVRCSVHYIINGAYLVYVKIHQRGEHFYSFKKGTDLLYTKYKKVYLDTEAQKELCRVIDEYDRRLQMLLDDAGTLRIAYPEYNVIMHILCKGKSRYDISAENSDICYMRLYENTGITQYFRALYEACRCPHDMSLFYPDKNDITSEPLYMCAKENNVQHLICDLEMCYGDRESTTAYELEKTDGIKRLVKLPQEYDRKYAVIAKTVDYEVLSLSGYCFLHKPGMAMRGSTRENVTLNPHTKVCIDASYADMEAVTFDEYVSLVNEAAVVFAE